MHNDLELAETTREGWPREVADGLAYLRTAIANVFFAGPRGAPDRGWVLVDAGVHGSAAMIRHAAEQRFGAGSRPLAIVLTHGHFDHVGALSTLAEEWDVPVYAHPLEMPYITGRSAYPPPDPTVDGGAMAKMSFLYPRGPFDVGGRARPLPADGSVPGMPGWRWIHTPGHAPGHVVLFRDADRTLIAGDVFVTTRQESLLSVLAWRPEVNRPPAYFTPDWESARRSVEAIAALEPLVAATGHGPPLRGPAMLRDLHALARGFREEMPEHGRYVDHPAVTDETGVVSVPPAPTPDATRLALAGLAAAVVGGVLLGALSHRRNASPGRVPARFAPALRSRALEEDDDEYDYDAGVLFDPDGSLDALVEDGGDFSPPRRGDYRTPSAASRSPSHLGRVHPTRW